MTALGHYVTPDEPAWIERSIHFVDALAARDWAAVPSTGHPGVTTMWLGAAGIAVQRLLSPLESAAHVDWVRNLVWLAPDNAAAFAHLAYFLSAARIAVALTTTAGLFVAYRLMCRLFDRRTALLATGLLALDPFLVGLSGLLHTDALLATFCLLALLAAFNGLRSPRPVAWWALSGLFTGLALLTKTPALILPPFLFLVLLVSRLRIRNCELGIMNREPQSAIPNSQLAIRNSQFAIRNSQLTIRLLSLASYLLTAGLTYVALYPALWANPQEVLNMVAGIAGQHVDTVLNPTFFLGQMTFDPGPAFYPLVFLLRISPVVLVGLLFGLFRLRRVPAERRLVFVAFLAFALLFGVAVSLAAKKHDRYLLPALLPLTVAAALALDTLPTTARFTRWLPLAFQLVLLLPFATYPLGYYNPLAGGPWVAEWALPVGWGEEMGAAAHWLNQLPDAERLTVAAPSIPSFAPLFSGRTVARNQAQLADYIVYFPARPTGLAFPPSRAQLGGALPGPPVYTATLGFLDRAVVVANAAPAEQAAYLAAHAGPDDLILLDADTPLLSQYHGPGEVASAATQVDEAALAAWLAAHTPGRTALWQVAVPGASPITAAHLRRQIQALADPTDTVTLDGVSITRHTLRPTPAPSHAVPYRAVFSGQVAVVDSLIAATVARPAHLTFVLRWWAPAAPVTDYQAIFMLRDADGRLWATLERPVLNDVDFTTAAWPTGEWTDQSFTMPLPPGIPPGDYALEVALHDAATGAGQGAAAPDGAFRGTRIPLGQTRVLSGSLPPAFAPRESARRVDLPAGPLTLLAVEPPWPQVPSGDTLRFALFWRADAAPQADYRVRLEVLDAAGQVVQASVEPLSPYPTSNWRAGEWFESRHEIVAAPDLPPGDYRLMLNVLDETGAPLWDTHRLVAEVTLQPRERTFDLPADVPHLLDVTFGGAIRLHGYGPAEVSVVPGAGLPLRLVWQATGPADRDYTLFVHLWGPDGRTYGQV
ncbi:MAG: glycosyltransferase family 39 protein, partial [Anaerolineae bacterium]|nr:glycosyltransferase family 39 protein [Anaerolineae bacterium]